MNRTGRYLLYEVAALAGIGGRYYPCRVLFAGLRGWFGPYRWPLRAVLAVACGIEWLFGPVSVAVMSRIACYLPYGVAGLARVGGRYDP